MSEHTVKSFDTDIENLRAAITGMGSIAEKMVSEAVDALTRRDAALAQSIIAEDEKLDALQREIEEQAIPMIARRQPMAVDLRELICAMRIAGDLERIGDLAKSIANLALAVTGQVQQESLRLSVANMTDLASEQLRDVLEAYRTRDTIAAVDVWRRDNTIDALYTSLFRELLTYMMEDPRNITMCTHLLFCAKNIERIGDHTTNIAESVYYLVTGQTLPAGRPKGGAEPAKGGA